MERALLVTIKLKGHKDTRAVEDIADELEELVESSGVTVADNMICLLERPTPNLLVGSGKAEEIALFAQEEAFDVVIFSHDLSGTQQRNLEDVIGIKTIDRTQLILDIFARHARSPEGKTQVELAQLQYLMPRLVGKGIILSRLGGGIGTRGPGEQKLEVDRRHIRRRIDKLKDDLKSLTLHRATLRQRRKQNEVPAVALVGYTNAGKSTLLNILTAAGQTVSDSLFTTLDPLSKGMVLPNGERVVISDTVGFLQDLPHHLIEAFKATLEEAVQSDLLIHVLDVAHPCVYQHHQAVLEVLEELGADKKPLVTALNKTDLIEDKGLLKRFKEDFKEAVLISASTGEGLPALLKKIQDSFRGRMAQVQIIIPHSSVSLIDSFYREGRVEEIKYLQEGIKIKLTIPRIMYSKLLHNNQIKEIS